MVWRKLGFAVLLLACLAGCGDRAKELFETGQFEEKQFNVHHAQQLYQEILDKYPESPFATQAAARLKALQQAEDDHPPAGAAPSS